MWPTAMLCGISCALALAWTDAAAAGPYQAPRTPDGQPDLQGTWTNASLTRLERPSGFASLVVPEAQARALEAAHPGKPRFDNDEVGQEDSEWWEMGGTLARIRGEARSSWIVEPADGRIPYTEEGRRALAAQIVPSSDGPEGRTGADRCLTGVGTPAGPPMMNSNYNSNYQILQTREAVVILSEMNHDVRLIRLDGGRSPPQPGRPWMGDSVGHWEGETLVVETRNLNPGESLHGSSFARWYSSPDAVVRERLTRTAKDEILYEFTIEDPATYSRPWRAEMVFHPARGAMFEVACHEGNYSMAGILAGARRAEAEARAAPPRTGP